MLLAFRTESIRHLLESVRVSFLIQWSGADAQGKGDANMGEAMPKDAALRRIEPCDVLCALGFALNLTWCSLEGHAMGFFDAAAGMSLFINPRVFWLLGIALVTVGFLCAPQFVKAKDHVLRFVVPVLASAGTVLFAVSYAQSTFDPLPVAMMGLLLSGMGHFWFSSRFCLLLARMRPFTVIVWVIVGALLIKTLLLSLSAVVLPPGWQVALAVAIPLVNALVFEGARRQADRRRVVSGSDGATRTGRHTVFGLPTLPRRIVLMKGGQRNLVLLIVMSGLMLATVRRLSFWGLWGAESAFPIKTVWGVSEFLTLAVCLIAFAYAAFVKTSRLSMSIRFQPATIVVVAGLFLIGIQQPGDFAFIEDAKAVIIHVDEAFAYLLFWSIMALSLDALDMPPFRVLGIGGMTFALASFGWVMMSGYVGDIDSAFIVLAAYVIIVVAMLYTYRESKRYSKLEEAEALQAMQVSMRASEDSDVPSAEVEAGNGLVGTITERCIAISEEYRLTPREAEVFCLLAQGRTRAFIQEELVLSASTVKTHVSHIYTKLAIRDRQEMMDLVLAERE